MMTTALTADLLHDLVDGSHTQGVTAMAVASTIDHDGRILLIVAPGLDFIDDAWELPTGPVLPGETLVDALPKNLAAIGLSLDEVTGYLGHHDRIDTDGEPTRVFRFAVTVTNPDSICRSAHIGHRWADLDDLPDPPIPPEPHPPSHATMAAARPPAPIDHPLAGPLRTAARGLCAAEAGTELLIRHATWLQRSDFRDRFVHLDTTITGDTDLADIDWPAVITALDSGQLACSGGDERMLRLVASLVDGIPVNLRDNLIGLDSRNIDLVSRAVLHLNGRRQQPPS